MSVKEKVTEMLITSVVEQLVRILIEITLSSKFADPVWNRPQLEFMKGWTRKLPTNSKK